MICELSDKQLKLIDAVCESRISQNIWRKKNNEIQSEIESLNNDVSKDRFEQFKAGEL